MRGVVAAGHPQTAEAGAEILRQGGNAVDAAVAAAFASFVAESSLVNIGGGGVAQIYTPTTGQATVFDFFSNMPGLSDTNGSRTLIENTGNIDFRKITIDFGAAVQPFYIGRGSVAVPGVVAGLCRVVEDAGTLPLETVLAPAIRLARDGVIVSESQRYIMQLLRPILTDTPSIAAIYKPSGSFVEVGDTLYFPRLAKTLEQLGHEGASLFYTGAVGQKILADQQSNGGLLTSTDLAGYQVYKTQPIKVSYRGFTILLPRPSSGGGPLIAFALHLLSAVSLEGVQPNSCKHLRALTEVMRVTNIARAEWESHLETPEAMKGRAIKLLNAANISRYTRQLLDTLVGNEPPPDAALPQGPSNTTHLSVADANGMLASITTSAGECSGFIVDDTGVKLNNMLGEIDLHPNGFHQLPPGRRLMTMMSPALVLYQGRPVLAIGSGGSNRLRSAILQVISNFIDFKMTLADAVDAPRLHFEDGTSQLEGGISPQAAKKLEEAGYTINLWPDRNMFFGGAHAVAKELLPQPHWVAAGDSRRGGSTSYVSS